MRTDLFDFDLPPDRIAQHPVSPRDAARLLHVGARLSDHRFGDLPRLLKPGDLLIFNDTKVIPARLTGRRGTAKVEITLHKAEGAGTWHVFARPAKKLKAGDRIDLAEGFFATVEDKAARGEILLAFNLVGPDLMRALERHGAMPLPPYIKRGAGPEARDRKDYQTIFARAEGAVAAPTAGLHFTPAMLEALDAAGIRRAAATLHVGAGTFQPVVAEDARDHHMHSEYGILPAATVDAIKTAKAAGGRIVAVGTTALRLLEAAAAASGRVEAFDGDIDLFILPGYRFRVVDLLLTNFHLPRSTLFMLVCAFAGVERMQAAYAHAIAEGYRFYSYGDCCLLEPAP